jgi:transcriptional regulator with XRE-family HTH domain
MAVKVQMEFHEKLQQLRKQNGLTQEALAEHLHVSRTAVSKWESGRGFPGIESLKAIAKFFDVSLDELLSGEEILNIAESDHKEKRKMIRDLVFGLLDWGMALLLVLPFFGEETDGLIRGTSLLSIMSLQPYMKLVFFIMVLANVAFGILLLILQNCRKTLWLRCKHPVSLCFSALIVCLFMISRQPYAAIYAFLFLLIKVFLLIKKP